MQPETLKKVFAIALIVMLISIFTLAAMQRISFLYFWIAAVFAFLMSYMFFSAKKKMPIEKKQ